MMKAIMKSLLALLAIVVGVFGFAHVFYKNFVIRQERIAHQTCGRIIVLNGTASTGKTPVARHLQHLFGKKYLYVSMDDFLNMLSWEVCNLNSSTYTFLQSNDGIYASQRADGTLDVEIGPLGKKLLYDMYHSVEMLLKDGWNVILTVIEPLQEDVLEMQKRFTKYNPYYIYLYANKNVIAQREAARGDRLAGYALNLLDKYTSQDLHDLQIDIGTLTQEQVAQKIYEATC